MHNQPSRNQRRASKWRRSRNRALASRAAFSTSALGALITAMVVLAGCGGSGGAVTAPPIAPARVFSLAGFQPAGPVVAGRPTMLSFTIQQPSGQPLIR